jgi:hypothetical protein
MRSRRFGGMTVPSRGAEPSRFRLTKSLSRALLHFAARRIKVRYTSHAVTRLLNI